jgi:hypothetical protein
MWYIEPTEEYARALRWFKKKRSKEVAAAQDNLDTYYQMLCSGVNPLQIKFGFHSS